MNRLFKTCYQPLALCLGLMLMFSCKSSDSDEPEPTFSISQTSIEVPAESNYFTITVTSNLKSWTTRINDSWVTTTTANGSGDATVTFNVSANTKTEPRSTEIKFVDSSDKTGPLFLTINQRAVETNLTVNVTSVNLLSTAGSSQQISINCNANWTLTGIPEWLSVSANSGTGNSTITVTSRTANASSVDREATLTITSNNTSVQVLVKQENGLAKVWTKPANLTALYFGVAFNLEFSAEAATTKILLMSDYDYKRKTEKDIIAAVEAEEQQIPEDETLYSRSCPDDDAQYHILTLAYDRNGNRGELQDLTFKAPKYLDGTNDAWCKFEDTYQYSDYIKFTVKKQGRCSSYHLIYGTNIMPRFANSLIMAYEINYFAKHQQKHWLAKSWDFNIELNYPNDHTFVCSYINSDLYYSEAILAAWGIFTDGQLSSDINMFHWDLLEDDDTYRTPVEYKGVKIHMDDSGWLKYSPTKTKK